VLQPEYNLYARQSFEGPLQDLAIGENLGVISYYALASGFLTGKYRSEADLGQSPRGSGAGRYLNERGLKILAGLDFVAADHSARPAEIALAWLIARPGLTAPIASASTPAQIETFARAVSLRLSSEDMEVLDTASA
jgi:aryl-alcohol dehydrogenase-like predicted oxidoreductase